jgi:hypothetical protein
MLGTIQLSLSCCFLSISFKYFHHCFTLSTLNVFFPVKGVTKLHSIFCEHVIQYGVPPCANKNELSTCDTKFGII